MVFIDPESGLEETFETLREVLAEVDGTTTGIPGTVTATAWPQGAPEPNGTYEWQALFGPTYTDPASGVTVYTTPDTSAIVPMFEDPDTHVWSINPDWVKHEESLGLEVPNVPTGVVPAPDPPTTFTGPGPRPTWGDVYQWSTDKARAEGTLTASSFGVTGDQVTRAVDVGMGTTIKALSGFIDKAFAKIDALAFLTKQRIDALQVTTFVAVANIGNRITTIENIITNQIRPALHDLTSAVATENTNRKAEIDQRLLTERQRVNDAVYEPLRHDIAAVHQDALDKIQALHNSIPNIIAARAPEILAATTAAAAALASRVKTLEDEAEQCTKPMCATMGPATPLGKFLKALSLLADLALFADLLSLTEPELIAKLEEATGFVTRVVTDFEGYIADPSMTLGGLITDWL